MKKLFTSLFLLALGGMILGTSQAWSYALYVGGKQVTGSSLSTGGNIKSGTIKYNDSSKTLTLTDVVVNVDGTSAGIYNEGIDNLTIYFEGNCSITTRGNGIELAKSTSLTTSTGGNLTIDNSGGDASKNFCCIWQKNGGELSISWLHIKYTGLNYGICGTGSTATETLKIQCCELNGTVTGSNSIVSHFKTVTDNANFWYDGLSYSSNQLRKGSSLAKTGKLIAKLKVGKNIVNTGNDWSISSSGKGVNSGSISYSNSTKTLTLNNVDFSITGNSMFTGFPYAGIENYGIEGLKIKVVGTNKFTRASGVDLAIGIHSREWYKSFNAAFTLEGDSYSSSKLTLDVGGTRSDGILTDGTLTVKNVNLVVNASGTTLYGGDLNKSDLNITYSKMTLKTSKSDSGVKQFKSCNLSSCDVKTDGVYFFTAKKGFTNMSGTYCNNLEIDIPSTWFNLYILGRQVTSLNQNNVVTDGQTAGKFSYSSGTLTLNGVVLTAPSGNEETGIMAGGFNCAINLTGTNEITTNGNVFSSSGDFTFTGSGNLTGTSTANHGISMSKGGNVTFSTTSYIIIKAAKYGYYGDGSSYNDKLTLKKATSDTYGYAIQGTNGAIYNVRNLVLDNMDYAYDGGKLNLDGCYFDDATHSVRQNGGNLAKGRVGFNSIKEKLGFSVGGKEVNRVLDPSWNTIAIGSPYITAGGEKAAVYDVKTKKLTLTNATINTGSDNLTAISNTGNSGLTISVKGNNTLKTTKSSYGAFYVANKTIISSETNDFKSSLTCDGGTSVGMGIYMNITGGGSNPSLTVQDKAVVNAYGSFIGIGGNNSGNNGETLNVNNASVYVTNGGVQGLKNFSMSNAKIVIPDGGYFNSDAHCIVASGSSYAYKVLILSVNDKITAIDAVEVNNDTEVRDIYDAGGRQLDGARQGLNIIRMKDGSVRKVMVK